MEAFNSSTCMLPVLISKSKFLLRSSHHAEKAASALWATSPLMMFACRSKNKGSTRRILKTTLQVREFWVLVRLQFPAPRSSGVPISWDAVVRPGVPTVRQNGSRRPLRVPEYLTSREAGRIKRKLLQKWMVDKGACIPPCTLGGLGDRHEHPMRSPGPPASTLHTWRARGSARTPNALTRAACIPPCTLGGLRDRHEHPMKSPGPPACPTRQAWGRHERPLCTLGVSRAGVCMRCLLLIMLQLLMLRLLQQSTAQNRTIPQLHTDPRISPSSPSHASANLQLSHPLKHE